MNLNRELDLERQYNAKYIAHLERALTTERRRVRQILATVMVVVGLDFVRWLITRAIGN
jgi:hypothetical protein